jgi:hypothetical protein
MLSTALTLAPMLPLHTRTLELTLAGIAPAAAVAAVVLGAAVTLVVVSLRRRDADQ